MRFGSAWRARSGSSRPRTQGATATPSARCRPPAFPTRSSKPARIRSPGLLVRFARGRGPFTTAQAADRFGLSAERAEDELAALERAGRLVRGELRPGGTEREWCEPDVLAAATAREPRGASEGDRAVEQRRSASSCRRGMESTGARRCAKRSFRCRASLSQSRSGNATSCRAACPATSPRTSTSSPRRARWSGSAPASSGSPCTSARTRRRSGVPPRSHRPRATPTTASARRSSAGRSFGSTWCARPGSRRKSCFRPYGISSGRAR